METNPNNIAGAMDFKSINNMLMQNAQMTNQTWNNMPNQGENQIQGIFQNDFMNVNNSNKDLNSSKSPWSTSEEHTFWERHEVLGNKWVEIAKSLPGRNDNAVKNYFYSSIRKYIRKIAKGRISAEQK